MSVKVKALGYVGCNVTSLDAWDSFLTQLFGVEGPSEANGAVRHLDFSNHEQRLTLRRAAHDSLDYVGWAAGTAADLREFEGQLSAAGIPFERGSEQLCHERGVEDLLIVSGPDAVRIELFCNALKSPRSSSAQRILASDSRHSLRLAHVVLACSQRNASVEWYVKNLGFSPTDDIFWDGIEASFLRCSPQHHSLALTSPVGDMRGGELGHFMFETDVIDDVGQAYDVVKDRSIPVAFTFGRHSNDQSFSFYVYSPSGWLVEYGYGGRLIEDPAWQPKLYDRPSIWGHEMLAPPGDDSTKQRY